MVPANRNRGTSDEPNEPDAMLRKVDTAAQRFDGLDRVRFFAEIAGMLREPGDARESWDDLLMKASDEVERDQRAAWRPPLGWSYDSRRDGLHFAAKHRR